jgi:predicted aminopeptidase
MRKKLLALVVTALTAVSTATCSPFYVLRAGLEEAKILSRRTPIREVIESPSTDAETRRKLELVLQARTYAQKALDLNVKDSYTTYSWVESDTLALVLSAARKDRFEPVTWWFPIVGRVPYKGYFSVESAERAARKLQGEGYDTYIRPTTAFSTLGWFNDPLLNTLLKSSDDVDLFSTVVHELTHNTLFLPGQVPFNESFASFIGDRAAIDYFCDLDGPESPRCVEARNSWNDNLVFGHFLGELIHGLEEIYDRPGLTLEERLAARERFYEQERERFARDVAPRLSNPGYRGFTRLPLNNARLIAWRIYYDRLDVFDAVYHRYGNNLRAALEAIKTAVQGSSAPYAALEKLAGTTND